MKNSPVHWLCLGLMLLLAQPAASQDVVGTTTIQNRSVELLSDKTWRYKDSQTAGLDEKYETIADHAVFCNSLDWEVGTPSGNVTAMYSVDGRNFVFFIIEPIGANDGMTSATVVEYALKRAASAMNIRHEALPVHYVRPTTQGEFEYQSVAYSGKINDLQLAFINNIYVGEKFSAQVMAYGIGELNNNLEAISKQLLERVSFIE